MAGEHRDGIDFTLPEFELSRLNGAEELLRSRKLWFASMLANKVKQSKLLKVLLPWGVRGRKRGGAGRTASGGGIQFHEVWGLCWIVLQERAVLIDQKKRRGEVEHAGKVFFAWAMSPKPVSDTVTRVLREAGFEYSRMGQGGGNVKRLWIRRFHGLDLERDDKAVLNKDDILQSLFLGNAVVRAARVEGERGRWQFVAEVDVVEDGVLWHNVYRKDVGSMEMRDIKSRIAKIEGESNAWTKKQKQGSRKSRKSPR